MAVVEDRDNGYKELVARIYGMAARGLSIDVGILEPQASEQHGTDAMTMLEIAIINHMGTEDGRIPARPFISGWFDSNEDAIREKLVMLMRAVLAGKLTSDQALEVLGQWCAGEIQARISRHGDGTYPENAPSTAARKRSSTPLINLGALRGAVSYRVNRGGETPE